MRRVLRSLGGTGISGNNYLALGGFVAALAVGVPVMGTYMAPLIVAVAALVAGIFIITLVGALVGPVVL